MTRDEFKEKIKVIVRQIRKPDYLAADKTVSLDGPKFPVLEKFSTLKDVIIDLLTDQYELFITDIQWVAPKPTTFRIILGNGEPFMLTYSPRSWIAQIEGKKYYLLNLSEEEAATEAIARVLSYGMAEQPAEAGTEGGDAASAESPIPSAEETPAETPEESPVPEV
jgi:hypothetical protein